MNRYSILSFFINVGKSFRNFCNKPEIKSSTKVITDIYKNEIIKRNTISKIEELQAQTKEETEEFEMLDIYIDEDEVRLAAYYIAEKDNFVKSPETYWEMGKSQILNRETKPLM